MKRRLRRIVSWLCVLSLCLSLLPGTAWAVDEPGVPLEEQHLAKCGYQCTHVHDETCGYMAAADGSPCTHVHDNSCRYVEGEEGSCPHLPN